MRCGGLQTKERRVQLVVKKMCSEQARAEGELAYSMQVHRVWRN